MAYFWLPFLGATHKNISQCWETTKTAKVKLENEIGCNCGKHFQPADLSEKVAWLLGDSRVSVKLAGVPTSSSVQTQGVCFISKLHLGTP